ncbi:MAG: hypothetical protein H6704_30530 [Myxococcales bacterium]|nr:hypothetical protein [Myxococcales bacterium]MCB9540577.1 hypothetical protein [Myxococcales bacterium]
MQRWLVDATPLHHLSAVAAGARWAWPPTTLEVAQAVFDEVDVPHEPRAPRHRLLRRATQGQRWIRVHDLALGSAAERLYSTYLRPSQTDATKHQGEDQSIALCATALTDAVFVTCDRQAALVALAELGPGRVATPFDVWADLERRGLVSAADRAALDAETLKTTQGLFPGVPRRLASG